MGAIDNRKSLRLSQKQNTCRHYQCNIRFILDHLSINALSIENYLSIALLSGKILVSSWIICRLTLYPLKIIYPLLYYQERYYCHPIKWWCFFSLLSILLMLHCFWMKYIVAYVISSFYAKAVAEDPRSESDEFEQTKKEK